jgi:hypothetical protein
MAGGRDSTKKANAVDRAHQRTCFQAAAPCSDQIDIRTDVAVAYGIDASLTTRIAEWKRRGYVPHVMTGAAWGGYEDYIEGRFDGKTHHDEGQVNSKGEMIKHDPTVPYMVPTPSYQQYLIHLARTAIDAGAEALHFEEPEFWSAAGYSAGFARVWETEYGEPWRRPDSSPDAYWKAAKLKYLLYKRTLENVFAAAKAHARSRGREVGCFVPTHSLVNYAQWGIVSPESSLMEMPNCDGYIAQVWTGTARTPNFYRGVGKERTFETAYLEYASMHSMVAPTGRKVFFLADPVEDNPRHTWDDYKANYERTVAASLLFPDVHDYEVMPWPDRVLTGRYPAGTYSDDPKSQITIPPAYGAELMTVVNALNEMEQDRVRWECGTRGIAVLASDTMMFQRNGPWSSDEALGGFFGMAMPLLKRGVPVRCVVLERVREPKALEGVDVLLMSYEHMKPMLPEYHDALARWVRAGGMLAYLGDDKDAFHAVREWWNDGKGGGGGPRADLFRRIGLDPGAPPGTHRAGEGWVSYGTDRPDLLARSKDGATTVTHLVDALLRLRGGELGATNRLVVLRGPYAVGGVLDEAERGDPFVLKGAYLDLFSTGMPVRTDPVIQPGTVFLMRDLSAPSAAPDMPEILGGSARVERISRPRPGELRILAHGPASVADGMLKLRMGAKPKSAEVDGHPGEAKWEWLADHRVLSVSFRNRPAGTEVLVKE